MFLCSRELLQRGGLLDRVEEGQGRIGVLEVGGLATLFESRLLFGCTFDATFLTVLG